ncbi:hypothetical protein V6U81_20605 [Micromonospora sp. CPCC 205711]|uniref:hypothetical protein n=1 Tax=Micromonospora sp. CPCC 205547 TaxID=3122400 RepID=UPI002FF2722E
MHKKLLAAAGAASLALLVFPAPAQANHSWGGYHWARTANPFTLKLGDNVSSQWDSALAGASSDWSKSTVLDTTVVTGSTNPKNCKGVSGRVEVCNSTYGNNGWLGIASISVTGGTHITQGTVKLNDTYFNTAQYNTPAWRNLVTCQEVGHTFGLDHQDENFNNANLGTCMDYTNDPSTNQHPNQHDYDQLVTIYSHVDSTSTVGSAPATASVGNSPKSWGTLVSGSRADRHSTYVRHFADGAMVVTHVIWA